MEKIVQQLENLGKAYRSADFKVDEDRFYRIDSRVMRAVSMVSSNDLSRGKQFARTAFAFKEFSIFLPDGVRQALKPVGVLAVVFVAIFGWFAAASGFQGLLPGDYLYGVKIATERAQVSLIRAPEERARLELDFARRRLDELTVISEGTWPNREERLTEAVDQFRNQITNTQNNLQSLTARESRSVAGVAKIIDRRVSEYGTVLNQTTPQVPASIQEKMIEARTATQEASATAMAALIENHRGGLVSQAEISSRVEEKLRDLEGEIQLIAVRLVAIPGDKYPEIEAIGGPVLGSLFNSLSKAREALADAKDMFVRGGYEAALADYRKGIAEMNQLEWGIGLYEQVIRARREAQNQLKADTDNTAEVSTRIEVQINGE